MGLRKRKWALLLSGAFLFSGFAGCAADDNSSKVESSTEFAADTSETEPARTAEAIIAEMLQSVTGTEISVTVSYGSETYDSYFSYLYDKDLSLVSDGAIAYAERGSSADEISVLYAAEASKVSALSAALEARISRRIQDFTGYVPEEVEKLSHAEIVTAGQYVALFIGDDISAMKEAFEAATK